MQNLGSTPLQRKKIGFIFPVPDFSDLTVSDDPRDHGDEREAPDVRQERDGRRVRGEPSRPGEPYDGVDPWEPEPASTR